MADKGEPRRIYLNPFGGRPAPVQLTRAFLLSPGVFMKLMGLPVNAAWKELGAESTFKCLEYHRKRGQATPVRLAHEVIRLLPHAEVREEFRRVIDEAEQADGVRVDHIKEMGDWESFLRGMWWGTPVEEYSYASRYVLALSDALFEPAQLAEAGEFAATARALYRNELTRALLSPEMSFALATVNSKRRFAFVRWAITLETALSQLAAWYAGMKVERRDEAAGDIIFLLEDAPGRRISLGRQFYEFLKGVAKQESMGSLVKQLARSGDSVDIQTLKRWSAGKTLPDLPLVKIIVRRCSPEHEERVLNLHWSMRYLSLLGHVSETVMIAMGKHLTAPGAQELFAPWPMFPFGHASFQDWCRDRFPFWYRHHLVQLAVGDKGLAAS